MEETPPIQKNRLRNLNSSFLEPRPWTDLAACKGIDQEIFYAGVIDCSACEGFGCDSCNHKGGVEDPQKKQKDQRAILICNWCPVSSECLEYAISMDDQDGIWGGKTKGQRNKIVRDRASNGLA